MIDRIDREIINTMREMLYCLLDEGMLQNYGDIDTASYRILNVLKDPNHRELYKNGVETRLARDSKNLLRGPWKG